MAPNLATKRLQKDIFSFKQEKCDGIDIYTLEEDIFVVHALIQGPEQTPYQNGFFYFRLDFPKTYPLKPPSAKLLTTGGNKVRFNPNLYACGKVCLSILGTWSGPQWCATQTLLTVLLSIRSLMNEEPYHNEPGREKGNTTDTAREKRYVDDYNEMITHETIRVAVIGMLEEKSSDAKNMPQELKNVMIAAFKRNYQFYEELIQRKLHKDWNRQNSFRYYELLNRLLELKTKYNITD